MIRQGLLALSFPIAGIAAAEGLTLQFPVDCVLGNTCHIQQYMDRDVRNGFRDYRCAGLSYNGHKGTDFALATRADMLAGVNVLAAADGRVRAVRDGMPDTGYSIETAARIKGKECGNSVVLVHPNGWETQYCHMKQGTVTIRKGQMVKAGDILGQIGQSGRAEFPHLHLSVRQGGKPIDPFDPDGTLTCNNPGDSTLWAETPPYQPGGIMDVGLSNKIPKYADVKNGTAGHRSLPVTARTLVVFGFSYGTQKGDIIRLNITGPKGAVITEDLKLTRHNARAFRAVGKRLRWRRTWPAGTYIARAALLRNDIEISAKETEVTLN